MDTSAIVSGALDLLQSVAAPAVGAAIALIGVGVNQRMQRATQDRSQYREEVRDVAANLLTLSETLWRRGWELWQESRPEVQAIARHGADSAEARALLPKRLAATATENDVHQQVLSAQRRLMLVSPALDAATAELVEASRLWPPSIERPDESQRVRRENAERDFIVAVRGELGSRNGKQAK